MVCDSKIVFLMVALAAAVAAAAEPPIGSLVWNQTIPGYVPFSGSTTRLFHSKYFAVMSFRWSGPLQADEFWLSVLDATSGLKLLDVTVGPVQQTPTTVNTLNALEVFENGVACVAFSSGAIVCGDSMTGKIVVNKTFASCYDSFSASLAYITQSNSIAVACGPVVALVDTKTTKTTIVAKTTIVTNGVLIRGATAYVVTTSSLDAYDLVSHKKTWSSTLPPQMIICATSGTIVTTIQDDYLLALDAATGKKQWEMFVADIPDMGVFCTDHVFFHSPALFAPKVTARNMTSGKELYTIDGQINNLVLDASTAQLMVTRCGQVGGDLSQTGISALKITTGALVWNITTPITSCADNAYVLKPGVAVRLSAPVTRLPDGTLVVPNLIGINFFSPTTGERIVSNGRGALQFSVMAGVLSGAVVGDNLFIDNIGDDDSGIHVQAYKIGRI